MVEADSSDFPYMGRFPKTWAKSVVVKKLPGTRWYVERGPYQHWFLWMDEVHDFWSSDLIPLQWVPAFAGASRTAVLNRAKSGGLTIVSFIMTETSKTFLGGYKVRDTKKQYDYAFISECKAWSRILSDIAERRERERK